MASAFSIRLDHGGIGEVLKSDAVTAQITALGEGVAAHVRASGSVQRHGLPVRIDHEITDRARSVVLIAHPAGLAVQAKYGVLTQAAAAEGLEVTAR